MNKEAFLLSLLAGLSTLIGYFIIYIKKDYNKIISSSLGLASGVMLYVAIFDLLPNALSFFKLSFYGIFSYIFWLLFFIIGILLSITLSDKIGEKKDHLYHVGLVSLLVLFMHNIPEGIITYITTNYDYKTGILLTTSIALHNIPEGIAIATPIYYATKNKYKTLFYVIIASIAEPIGALIGHYLFSETLSSMLMAILYSIVAGIMSSIAITELIPEALNYSKKNTYIYLIIGIAIIYISHLMM